MKDKTRRYVLPDGRILIKGVSNWWFLQSDVPEGIMTQYIAAWEAANLLAELVDTAYEAIEIHQQAEKL